MFHIWIPAIPILKKNQILPDSKFDSVRTSLCFQSRTTIAENGFVFRLWRQAGVLPDCLVLVSCDAAKRVGRIRSREQECLDLELDDQANIAKSEKWEENWRASIGRISQAGVAVFHIDTSTSTVEEEAETVHNWIYALEEVRKREQ